MPGATLARRSLAGLAAVLALAAAGLGHAAGPGAATWQVDKPASRLSFRGAFGGEAFDGVFRRWDAQIVFDPKALQTARVVVVVDLASAATGDATRDEALPTDDWFATGRFPRATFTAQRFRAVGPGRYEAQGDLVIRGVRRPLTLPFTLQIAGDVARMNAALSIDRTSFGVGQGQFKNGDTVAAAVAVGVRLTAKRAK